jgi:hypothetical protein
MSMRAGDVIWNPLTGEKALLVETADETDGARIVADFAVEAGGFVPGGERPRPLRRAHRDSGRTRRLPDRRRDAHGDRR